MFQHSVDLHTTPEKAMERARTLFTYGSLEVHDESHQEILLKGTGLTPNQKSMLCAIKTGRLTVADGRVEITAEFGSGLLGKMIAIFWVIFTLLVFGSVFHNHSERNEPIWMAPAFMGLFAVICINCFFMMKQKIKREIQRALDAIAAE